MVAIGRQPLQISLEGNLEKIPEPEDSGSSGTQIAARESVSVELPDHPIAGQPIEQAIAGLAATRSRSLGGDVAASLLVGSVSQISHQLSEARTELKALESKLERCRFDLQTEKVNNATLKGKLESIESEKAIRSVCLVAGTAVSGLGLDQVKSSQWAVGITLVSIGIALFLIGWFSVGRSNKQ